MSSVGKETEMLAVAVRHVVSSGERAVLTNADLDVVWEVEADQKVDENDLTFPAIVHMRDGTLMSDSGILMFNGEDAEGL